MQRRKLTKVTDLPSEFKLDNYLSNEKYPTPLWFWSKMLEARVHRMVIAGDREHVDLEELRKGAMCLLKNPLWPATRWPLVGDWGLCGIGALIADQTAGDYFEDAQTATDDDRLKAWRLAWIQQCERGPYASPSQCDLDMPTWKMYDQLGVWRSGVTITVNLAGAEEVLVDDFRTWLRQTQSEF